LAKQIGIAPGPANGFTLDLLQCFERFSQFIDWAMIILNPLEPWPGSLVLPAAEKHGIDILTRVVDYGGLFHDDVRPGHSFRKEDHRVFRPAGWVEAGCAKMEQMRDIARKHNLTLLQLACIWNLSQSPVKSVIPTLIQEAHADAKKIEDKVQELAKLPQTQLSREEVETIRQIGENKGCMSLKGANVGYSGERMADYWGLTPELEEVARRWKIDPAADLVYSHGAQPARK
jgi:aryl-alcohol dehydrogenase-like predicted oxidoreductase